MAETQNQPTQDVLLDHDYDGIKEYDNPSPPWLVMLIYGTVTFAIGYMIWYGFNFGPALDSAYLQESQDLEAQWQAYYLKNPIKIPGTEELVAATKDPNLTALGKKQFETSCAPCHGAKGEGLIGPNLTDDRWLHGGKMTNIYDTVVKGVAGKGMPPWGRALSPDKVKGVVAHVRSLQGTNPPNPKAPEGEKAEPDPL